MEAFNRVPTDLESHGESGNFVGGLGKIARISYCATVELDFFIIYFGIFQWKVLHIRI